MEEIDIKELLQILFERKKFIILCILIFMLTAYLYNARFTPALYKSSTTLLLAQTNEQTNNTNEKDLENTAITQTDILLNEKLVSTYSELAKSNGVINQIIQNLNLNISVEELKSSISVSEVSNTEIFKISVSNKDAKLAALIANELSTVFTQKIEDLYSISNIKVVDKAIEATKPFNINPLKHAFIGAIIGAFSSVIIIIGLYMIKNAARNAKQLEKLIKSPVIASISKNIYNEDELTAYRDAKSAISETFKALRTNIKFYNKKALKTIAITSSVPEEGKSWISSNLASIFARNGDRVLLIDADMRRGRQHKVFNLPQKDGLAELLRNNDLRNINSYIKETNIENLDVITCGTFSQDSSELLLTNVFENILKKVKINYDVVFIDTTPNSIVTDGVIISRLVDSNILVTKYNSTSLDTIEHTSNSIKQVGGNILGIIMNQMNNMSKRYEELYYYGAPPEIKFKAIANLNKKIRIPKRYY